jgi:polar amino acid transport system substrate-binding protein
LKCLKAEECDVGFLGFVQHHRASDVGFSPPYIVVPFTLMVPADSSIHTIEDVDKDGIRIAAIRTHGSSLALSRFLKHAKTLDVEVPKETFELLRTGRADG